MKFLIVGLGSMGKRRIRNLVELQEKDVMGFDINEKRCKEVSQKYSITTFSSIDEALDRKPDAMIISTPPDLHMKYAKIAIKNNINFFTEASVTQNDVTEVINDLNNLEIVGQPSCTMRYHPIVEKINDILKIKELGNVLAFTYHSGQYLPDWHPWEDYRKFYVSKRETGACREIVPFELIWLVSTFGSIKSVIGDKFQTSLLDVDIDDIYNSILEFENGIRGMLTVDVISRVPIRQIKILTSNGMINADWYERKIKYFTKEHGWKEENIEDGTPEQGYIHGENMYIKEMTNFVKTIKKEIKSPYTFQEDLDILKILEAIEESNKEGIRKTI